MRYLAILITFFLLISVNANAERMWVDFEGDYLIDGDLFQILDDVIQIKSRDGKIVEYPKATLSPDDQHFINEQIALDDEKKSYLIKLTMDKSYTVYRRKIENEEMSSNWVYTHLDQDWYL